MEKVNELEVKLLSKDTSPIIPQRSKLKNELHIKENFVFTEKQQKFIDLALNKNTKVMFVEGPAGTAKTTLSVYCALKLLNEKRASDLIYARSAVECSEKSIGYLPGSLDEKIGVYLQPLVDKLEELLPRSEIDMLKNDKRITGMPISFLRGLSWNCKVIIGDEFQNCSYKEILTFLTRIGERSKIFILGDSSQSDINGKSGLSRMINIFNDQESRDNGIFTFQFDETDIVRSGICAFIIRKINKTTL